MHVRLVSPRSSSSRTSHLGIFSKARSTLLVVVAAIGMTAVPASSVAQAVKAASTPPPELSRLDMYAGYGYIHPVNSDINNYFYQPINPSLVASTAAYFNRYFGIQVEGNFSRNGSNDSIYTAEVGPIFRYQKNRLVPFAHALGGTARLRGPAHQTGEWGWGATGGVGIDYILPIFNNRFAIRPIQADFHYAHVDFGPLGPDPLVGGVGQTFSYRLSAGGVLRLGQINPPPPVQLGCSAQPANIFAGDPVTVTATPANLNMRKKATYTWSTSGGQLSSTDAATTVTTAALPPGDYTVTGHVSEGIAPGQQASCTAEFRVHAYEPPTLTCSANPSTVLPGDSVTITSIAGSPQNRTISYSYSASAGQISGTTPTSTLNTSGAPAGPITVTCNAVDDLGKQATATTTVTITVPPPSATLPVRSLCSVSFERDTKRPVRVDNEAKGCLDEIALTLNRDTTSRLVIIGRHSADESPDAAAQRDLNVEQYLKEEKGIDPSRIDMRTSGEPGRVLDSTLVPAGASFIPGDTTILDLNSVKQYGQPYSKPKSTKVH